MPTFDEIKDSLIEEEFPDPRDLDELPEQITFEATQPGTFTFTLPPQMNWATVDTANGQRVRLDLKKDFRLSYKVAGKDRKLSVGLSNIPIGRMGAKLEYLLQALGYDRPLKSNKDFLVAFENFGGAQFRADVVLTASNKNTGDRYSTRPYLNKKTGQQVRPIPRGPDGKYESSFVDEHGESLQIWPDLENFRPAVG